MVVKKKTVARVAPAAKNSAAKKLAPAKPAAVKKAAPAKKPTAPVKTVAAVAPKTSPATSAPKKCGMICWKKLVIFLLGVTIGAGAILATGGKHRKGFHQGYDMFKGGCLDISKIKGAERIEKLRARGLDVDGCITKEQFFEGKVEGMHKGCDAECPHKMNKGGERARPERAGRGPRGEGRRGPRAQKIEQE